MSAFSFAVDYMLRNEGGLVDNEHDTGGITNFGISLRFYKTIYPDAVPDDIRNLSLDQAKEFYRKIFWDESRWKEINCQVTANLVFDMHVNMGMAAATKILQRALCSVVGNVNYCLDDGIFGDNTLAIVNHIQEIDFLVIALRSERAAYYREIIIRDPSQKIFLDGWLNRAYGM
jgi:lysozyme family protein